MSEDWSPDQPLDTETYESWDEALDDEDGLRPEARGNPEGERDLDRQLVVDNREVEELGAAPDDPEHLAILDGGIDDPDGADLPRRPLREDEEGWDLDAGEASDPSS